MTKIFIGILMLLSIQANIICMRPRTNSIESNDSASSSGSASSSIPSKDVRIALQAMTSLQIKAEFVQWATGFFHGFFANLIPWYSGIQNATAGALLVTEHISIGVLASRLLARTDAQKAPITRIVLDELQKPTKYVRYTGGFATGALAGHLTCMALCRLWSTLAHELEDITDSKI